jgi:hypothetical protein
MRIFKSEVKGLHEERTEVSAPVEQVDTPAVGVSTPAVGVSTTPAVGVSNL